MATAKTALTGKTVSTAEITTGKGLPFERYFTDGKVSPFDAVEWERRAALIGNEKGVTIFRQDDVEVPRSWSQTATPRELDAEQLWRTLDALVARVLTEAEVNPATELAGVGCGCGGPMEWPAGKVSPLNIPAWQAFPLRDRLRERFGGLAVRLHNDAICFAVGEHWRGAGRGS